MKLKEIYESIVSEYQDAHGFDKVLPYIEQKLGIKAGERISSGTMSDVFDLGSKVLKITSTPHDIGGLYLAQKYPEYPMPKVYELYRIPDEIVHKNKVGDTAASWLSKGHLWVAVVEKVKTGGVNQNEIDGLRWWYNSNTELEPNDMTHENVGWDSTGRLVYLDPNFVGSENYARKVPKLQ